MTEREFYRSLALFLIYEVEEDTRENVVDIFKRWQTKTGTIVRNPKRMAWTLEYLSMHKNYRREALIEAALIDGFITRQQAEKLQSGGIQ